MNSDSIRHIAEKVFKELGFPAIYTDEDSVIQKFFLKVIERINDEYVNDEERPLGLQHLAASLTGGDDSPTRLRSVCSFLGIPIFDKGGNSYAEITLFFMGEPRISLPADYVFYSGDKKFYLKDEVVTNDAGFANEGLGVFSYRAWVYSPGTYSAEKNTLMPSTSIPSLFKIENPRISATHREYSVPELRSIINSRVYGGISSELSAKYPSVSVDVVSSGDPLMKRNVMYIGYPYAYNYVKTSNFVGKVRGDNTLNKNVAHKLILSEGELDDSIDMLYGISEVTQDDYLALNDKVSNTLDISSTDIVNCDFNVGFEKLGLRSELIGNINTEGDKLLWVREPYKFTPGDNVMIVDETDSRIMSMNVVRDIVYDYIGVNVEDNPNDTITIPYDITHIVGYAGDRIFVEEYSNATEEWSHVETSIATDGIVHSEGETTVTLTAPLAVGTYRIVIPVVRLYRGLGFTATTEDIGDYYIETSAGSDGMFGSSWIRSDDGMDVGRYRNMAGAMVVDGELVLGLSGVGNGANPMLSFISKYGDAAFVRNILASVSIVKPDSLVDYSVETSVTTESNYYMDR